MTKEIIDFSGLKFENENQRVKVPGPRKEEGKREEERGGLIENLRNLLASFLG